MSEHKQLPPNTAATHKRSCLLVVATDPRVGERLASTSDPSFPDIRFAQRIEDVLEILGNDTEPFDGALLDLTLGTEALNRLASLLRTRHRPCHFGVFGDANRWGGERTIFATGAIAFIPNLDSACDLTAALKRIVYATLTLRASCTGTAAPSPHITLGDDVVLLPTKPRTGVESAVDGIAGQNGLSPRERSILRYIALGYRYQEIGHELSISPRTVKMHASNVRRKVGAGTRWELMRKMFAQ